MESTNIPNPPIPNSTQQDFVAASAPAPVISPASTPAPVQNEKKHRISFLNISILILVVALIVSWVFPVPAECGRGGPAYCMTLLPALLEVPIVILTFIVGLSFVGKMLMLGDGKNAVIKIFNFIVGVGVGIIIIIVGSIAGLIGGTRATGSV